MADTDPGVVRFYPWMRRGLASLPPDTLDPVMPSAVSVAAQLQIHAGPTITQQFALASPADVVGFDARQVIRTEPPAGARNYEPNFLAAIEFDRPDFPWLFTPAAPRADGRLRPWLCLVAVRQQPGVGITAGPPGLPPVLGIDQPAVVSAELPDLVSSWAWAHAQVVGDAVGSVDEIDAQTPQRTLSRLIAAQRLQPDSAYYACVVPAFHAGRASGLGLSPGSDDATLKPAWSPTDPSVRLPVYYMWEFQTGPAGDFASLVALLKAHPFATGSGTRSMYVGAAGQGLPAADESGDTTLALGSALLPAATTVSEWTGGFGDRFRNALRSLIDVPADTGADPPITPPLYAGRHADQAASPPIGTPPLWLGDLNLNPGHRAVAAYGTRVIQQEQEALMASAWDQAGDLARANGMLRQAQLLRRAAQAIHRNHISKLPASTLLQLSRPVHTRVAVAAETTLSKQLTDQNVPAAIVSPAFSRVARPNGPVMRSALAPAQRMTARTVISRVAAGLVWGVTAVPTYSVVTPEAVEARYKQAGGTRAADAAPVNFLQLQVHKAASFPPRPFFVVREPELPGAVVSNPPPPPHFFGHDNLAAARFREAMAAHQGMLGPAIMVFIPPKPALNVDTVTPTLLSQIEPATTVSNWVRPLIRISGRPATGDDTLDPISGTPQFPQPMYEALRDIAPDAVLAGLNDLPDNTVSLLQPNAPFVAAFMAGLNHEMGRELLWRGYPTDQRGTYFATFWDRRGVESPAATTDIPPIHTWPAQRHLSEIASLSGDFVVMLIRGELVRRYPNAVFTMVQANWPAGHDRPALGTNEVQPIMRGTLDPGTVFTGFPVSKSDAVGAGTAAQPGWFFVIAEHPCAPRFGVAPDTPAAPLAAGSDAVVTATTYLQPPVRLAIHARDLLAGIPG
jgi:hypothetical protein